MNMLDPTTIPFRIRQNARFSNSEKSHGTHFHIRKAHLENFYERAELTDTMKVYTVKKSANADGSPLPADSHDRLLEAQVHRPRTLTTYFYGWFVFFVEVVVVTSEGKNVRENPQRYGFEWRMR